MKRIIVKGTNWIGDVLLSLPAVYSLKHVFPDATIDIALKRPLGDLLRGVKEIDSVLDYDDTLSGELSLVCGMRNVRHDLGIIFPRSLHSALLVYLGGARRRIGYAADARSLFLTDRVARTPEIRATHQSQYYRHIVSVLGEPGPLTIPRIAPDADADAWANDFLRAGGYERGPLFGINPGAAYGGAKRWRPDRFAAVADRLVGKFGGHAVIMGGQMDRGIEAEVAGFMKSGPIRAAGATTIRRLISLINRCTLFITNDSGPMHIAAALSAPVVAVFGPTNPDTTSPMGRAAVVWHEFECSRCLLRTCPIDHRCMESVTADEVYDAAIKLLSEGGGATG
ncbi:MAG: lipopolysaccharide heptosyltransferase II [Deltaproteobacteria bacterium]|nr:lipopolysaccharide heptosyltransferase II [Candidatus Zymogenaceae bacterium]